MTYAAKTQTPIAKTRIEIETLLGKHGAAAFGSSQDGDTATLAFRMGGYSYRFKMTVPDNEQKARSIWRALLLVIKARLEGVAAGVETIEEAFMANTVMAGGSTVAEWLKPEFAEARRVGRMPQQLALSGPNA